MAKIDAVQQLQLPVAGAPASGAAAKSDHPSFSQTLKDAIGQTDALQKNSAEKIKSFLAGSEGNLHEVMAAMEEAQLSFQLMLEVRNKLLESYQEIMRMQI